MCKNITFIEKIFNFYVKKYVSFYMILTHRQKAATIPPSIKKI